MFFFALLFISTQAIHLDHDRNEYFRAIINIPKDCTLKTEPGIVAFIDSGYAHYPLLIKLGSNKTTVEFFDITDSLIEEVNIEGFKKTQIENLLDNRGFYCENEELFKEQDITEGDFSFLEYFTEHQNDEFVEKNTDPVEIQQMKETIEEQEKKKKEEQELKEKEEQKRKEEELKKKEEELKKKQEEEKKKKEQELKEIKKEQQKTHEDKEIDELEQKIKNMVKKNGGNADGIGNELKDLIFNSPNIKIVRYTEDDLKKEYENDNESDDESK